MNTKYTLDKSTFASIDSEAKAYCLGFFLADAWITTGDKGISFSIHEQDSCVIDYVRRVTKSNAPTHTVTRTSGFNTGGKLLTLNLCSKDMVNDLKGLGYTKQKAKLKRLPTIPPELLRHMLRGLFDGNGSIGTRQFWLVGGLALLRDVVRVSAKVSSAMHISGNNNGYPRLSGGIKCAPFLHWLYQDCEFALPRKLARYRDNWLHPRTRGALPPCPFRG